MKTNSTFAGSYTESPFWFQQFNLRQIRVLRGGQAIVDFDAADKCRLYVTTRKAMNLQVDIPSIPTDNFKDHYALMFDSTSMQDAAEKYHYQELVAKALRQELNFTFLLDHVTELIVLRERMCSVAIDQFGVVGMDNVVLRQLINSILPLKYRYLGSFPSIYVPFVPNETFAIIKTQPSNMQG